MATSQSPRGVPSKEAQIEGYVCIQSHTLLSLTSLDSQFQYSNNQLLQDSIQDRLNVEHASPSLSSNGNTNNNTTPNSNHRNDFNSITDAITPTQISSRQAAGSNSTPRARLNLDCSVGQFDHAATTASARYEQALRFHHDECESSGIMQEGTNWRNVWASLRNGEISIWSDRSSSISSPESPLCLIPLSTFNHSSTDPPNSKAASWEITLFSNPPTSLRSASYGSTNQRSLGHQAQTISSSQSPPLDQGSSSTTFPWTRSISKGSLMKSTSSRTLADALRFGTSSSSTDASIPDQNKRELNHSNSQSTLNADVKENRKERGGSAWAKILRSRRLKSFMPTSQSSDSLSDQLSINGSVASSSRHGGEGMGSEDGNARDRGTSISSSPLSRSIALPSPGFSSSSHSTTATSINQSPTTSSCPKTRQPPSKIILQLSSASSMSQWNEAIKCHSKTSFQSERSQTSPTNASSSRKRPPLASIPGFSSPPSGETRDAYIQSSTSRSNLQQPLSPTILPRNQASNSGRFGTLPSSQSESILVMQATSESKLSQRRKERADAARNQEPSQSQTSWNDPFPSKQPEEGINVSIKSQSRHPKKQSSVPVVSSGPLTSLKSSSSRTGLSALLTGRKRGREDQKKQPSQEQVDTALHRQVQNCRASIEITPGNSRGKGEFYRPSTSSGASLKSFGSNSSPANEAADHQRGKAAKKRDARPTSAAGYEHVQARNSFTLTSGLTHAQNLAKQYLAGQRETPPSPVLSNASCMTTATGASVSEVSSEYVPPGMPFLKELANRRTSSPLAKEAMLPELTSLTIPSRDGQGRMRGASPQFRSSSPLSNQSTFTSPNSITQSLYTPSEGGESALDRFARVREGSFSQGPHGLGLEGVDQGSNGNGERFTFKSQRSWSKSPSFAPSSEITSTSPNPQSTLRQVTLKRLRGTPSRGSMESSREEDLEESDLPDRRSSLNGSALGISFSPSLNLPFKSSSPSLSGTSNALGLSRSPSLRGLANKLLLRPSSASGISSPLQFSSSRNSTSEPRESRDSESSYYDGRASSGDTSNSGRSLEFDNEIDIDDYEMIPSPSLPIINLHPSATPTRLTTELVGSTNEKASLGRKTRKTAERWANRLGSSPRMNSSTNKTIADVQDNYNSLSVSEANHQRRKQSSSSSSTSSSPPIIERILPPEQIISILDNLRDGSGRSLDSKDAAAAREAMLRSSSENHQSQFPQRRSPKPAPRSNRRPRTSNTSPTKRSHRDVVHDQRTTSPALTTRRTLGSIQSSMSEQSGLSLPPPPRMSKRPSGTSLAATLENAEEGNQTTSFSTPHTKNKKLSRSASEAAISTESSGSTPIQDLNSAFPSPIRRSRRQQSSNDKENDIGRKRSNSTLSCQSSEDLHCSSQEVLLESEDKEVESFSSRLLLSGESCDSWTTFGNHHKTLTASQTSNTFVNVKSSNGHSNCHGDESFATVTASNSSSSTLEGSQEAVLFHVTGKKVISQI